MSQTLATRAGDKRDPERRTDAVPGSFIRLDS
jgi:hypothetical protein